MSKAKDSFEVIEGGIDGDKVTALKGNFTPPALTVVQEQPKALSPHPSVFQKSATPPKNKLRYLTNNPFMRNVIDAYQNAFDSKKQELAVIWDHHTEKLIFVTATNENHLAEIIIFDYESAMSLDSDAQYQPVYIFDDTSKPFETYVTRDQIKQIQDWRDLADISRDQAEQNQFDNPYGRNIISLKPLPPKP